MIHSEHYSIIFLAADASLWPLKYSRLPSPPQSYGWPTPWPPSELKQRTEVTLSILRFENDHLPLLGGFAIMATDVVPPRVLVYCNCMSDPRVNSVIAAAYRAESAALRRGPGDSIYFHLIRAGEQMHDEKKEFPVVLKVVECTERVKL